MGLALGDVAGKGVAAALMMAKFSGDTRYCILTENEPAATAMRLNGLLCAAGIEDKFITLSLSVLDAPNRTLTLASAGHNPVLIRRASGQVEEVGREISGVPLGIMDDAVYEQTEVQLQDGDVVVIYSDGVTDARSPAGELYDFKDNHRLLRRVAQSSGGPVAIGRSILQDIREFSAEHPQADDITLVCFGPTPG
jgi:serine phosphatase RsbU (regulator of sigma subunit)